MLITPTTMLPENGNTVYNKGKRWIFLYHQIIAKMITKSLKIIKSMMFKQASRWYLVSPIPGYSLIFHIFLAFNNIELTSNSKHIVLYPMKSSLHKA